MNVKQIIILGLLLIITLGHHSNIKGSNSNVQKHKINLTSPAFNDGEKTPKLYTCDGREISPPLNWSKAPENTKSFLVTYRNYQSWTFWILYNIPPDKTGLKEGIPGTKLLSDGSIQGINSEKTIRYFGACPYYPQDTFFKIYALDTKLEIEGSDNWEAISEAMKGHILGEGTLRTFYFRSR